MKIHETLCKITFMLKIGTSLPYDTSLTFAANKTHVFESLEQKNATTSSKPRMQCQVRPLPLIFPLSECRLSRHEATYLICSSRHTLDLNHISSLVCFMFVGTSVEHEYFHR